MEGLERAKSMIERMFQEIEVGKVYTGKVVSITAFGAFMEVLPGKDGLIHVSELAEGRTEHVEDVVKKGDVITAKCLGVDEKGRVKMSRRAWLREQKAAEAEAAGISGD
jgi:polyribonucleotide nucleotidyltransferase